MKKKLIKATLFVAAVALTSTASLVAYDRYQKAQFAVANPMFEENLEALADPSSNSSTNEEKRGPALKVFHDEYSLVRDIYRNAAMKYYQQLYPIGWGIFYREFEESFEINQIIKNIDDYPYEYRNFLRIEKGLFWEAKRYERIVNGEYNNCTDHGITSLYNGRPQEGMYLTESQFRAEFL